MASKRPRSSGEDVPHLPVGVVPSHGISIDVPPASNANRPPLIHHVSTPAYESPLRHHTRTHSKPRQVRETLNARSEYTNSEDDGVAQHRINQYIIKQEIGRGSFGAVHFAVDQYGTEYAVKEFSKSRLRKRAQSHILRGPHGGRRRGHLAAGQSFNHPLHQHSADDAEDQKAGSSLWLIKEEIAIMKKLNHNNLVSLIEVLDDPEEDSLYMVMEMCKKGVVMKVGLDEGKADPYDDECCRTWFRDLILGIEYLHAQGVVHRDIKPDNCLLTEDDVLKIVDFGVSEMFEKDSEMLTVKSAGSPAFLPPELCVAGHGGISGKAADVWSMGVTLYCLRYGRIPFEKTGIFELYESIRSDDLDIQGEQDDDFRDLMFRILEKDPAQRIQMPELREHPWVTKRGTDPLLSAEENTADLVEPPTEEEMNHAITGNMSNLLVVMKAAGKFKRLLAKRRPNIMASILDGEERHLVSPPLPISPPHSKHSHHFKSHSVETYDRRPIEQILVAEGVHRQVDLENPKTPWHPPKNTELSPSTASTSKEPSYASSRPQQSSYSSSHRPEEAKQDDIPVDRTIAACPEPIQTQALTQTKSHTIQSPAAMNSRPWEQDGTRGHAHDPSEEHLFLHIGASSFADPSSSSTDDNDAMVEDDENIVVSESPGATEGNIFESAYQEEIERIRSRTGGQGMKIYLTRRVEGGERKPSPNMGMLVGGLLTAKKQRDKDSQETMKEERRESDDTTRQSGETQERYLEKPASHSSPPQETKSIPSETSQPPQPQSSSPETKEAPSDPSLPPTPFRIDSQSSSMIPEPGSDGSPPSTGRRISAFGRAGFKGLLSKMKGKVR